MKIYTVTSIKMDKDSDATTFFEHRCFGWYPNWFEARDAVLANRGNIEECIYDFAVIEEFGPGVPTVSEGETWFKFKGNKWQPCKKPRETVGVVNWGLG